MRLQTGASIRGLAIFLVLAASLVPSVRAQRQHYEVVAERGVPAKMRDGVVLRADIYRPKAEGKFPVLLQRTPYDKRGGVDFGYRAAALGYVVIIQDVRGRYTSEGEWYPFKHESDDGYDTVEWAAALPYSDGKVGMFGGLCLAFPFIASQLWLFVAPGLYRNERKAILPFLLASPVLFVLGGSFVYYVMLPVAIKFFTSFQTPGGHGMIGIQLLAKVSDYLDFVMTLIIAFGLTFQMPVLLGLLGRVGIISAKQLRSLRRYAIVGIFAVAAVATPPDVFSQLSLALPLLLLYEISILLVWMIEKKRAEEEAADASDE